MRAGDIVQRPPATIDCAETITAAAQLMDGSAVGALVVSDHDVPVGMVTVDDLLVDIAGVLSDVARPVTGQVLFGHPEPGVPAT